MTPTPDTHPSTDTRALPAAVQRVAADTVGLALRRGAAAGLLWSPGVVVTAGSALWRAPETVALLLPGGETATARVRGSDAGTDLAALSFDSPAAPACERAADAQPQVGDFVFAVGREPSGRVQASFGHVGAAGGEWRTWRGGRVERFIRLDGGLYPGLVGAPVADAAGRVLGIASPALSRHHGVVLPLATVERVLVQLLAHGRVHRPQLGVALQPVRCTLEGAATDGLLVSAVADGGAAANAGVLVGDAIVGLAGQPTGSIAQLRDALTAQALGSTLVLRLARGGRALELPVQAAEPAAAERRC
jgi:S1-C subfamily serine protease